VREEAVATSEEYRQLAIEHRLLAQQERLPNARAILAASSEKWEFLAEVTACEEQNGLPATAEPHAHST
jgi:hypothetical protein